jgi:hypothetical protein
VLAFAVTLTLSATGICGIPLPDITIPGTLEPVLIAALKLGGTVYLLNIPFLILAFTVPFFRRRFGDIFGIELIGARNGVPNTLSTDTAS